MLCSSNKSPTLVLDWKRGRFMSEKFNFTKNLQDIIGSDLKKYGFKTKNCRLTRNQENRTDEIHIQ